MPDTSVAIDAIEIRDQKVAYTVTFGGTASDALRPLASVAVKVYDGSGTERWTHDQPVADGFLTAPQSWETELPTDLDDGDYAAWVWAWIWDDPTDGSTFSPEDEKTASQGVSFLVGRGRIYASTEAVGARDGGAELRLGDPRLNGTWVVTDVTNTATYDVPTVHSLIVFVDSDQFEVKGEELVQAGATQQLNHLLPENLPDGNHPAMVSVRPEGTDVDLMKTLRIEKHGDVVALVPDT